MLFSYFACLMERKKKVQNSFEENRLKLASESANGS